MGGINLGVNLSFFGGIKKYHPNLKANIKHFKKLKSLQNQNGLHGDTCEHRGFRGRPNQIDYSRCEQTNRNREEAHIPRQKSAWTKRRLEAF